MHMQSFKYLFIYEYLHANAAIAITVARKVALMDCSAASAAGFGTAASTTFFISASVGHVVFAAVMASSKVFAVLAALSSLPSAATTLPSSVEIAEVAV